MGTNKISDAEKHAHNMQRKFKAAEKSRDEKNEEKKIFMSECKKLEVEVSKMKKLNKKLKEENFALKKPLDDAQKEYQAKIKEMAVKQRLEVKDLKEKNKKKVATARRQAVTKLEGWPTYTLGIAAFVPLLIAYLVWAFILGS